MGFSKATYAVDNITSLSVTPNATEGLTAAQLQAKFDKTGADGKTYVNNLVDELDSSVALQNSGWIQDTTTTFSYTSATRIATSVDLTAYIGIGDKVKYKQTTYRYGYVIAITSTYIDITSGTDYTVANEPITEFYFSHISSPVGFPQWFNYEPAWQNLTTTTGTSVAMYRLDGTIVTCRLSFTLGASSAVTGQVTANLPIVNAFACWQPCNLTDAGSNVYNGGLSIGNSTAVFDTIVTSGATAQFGAASSSNPFTWTTGDGLSALFRYSIV